MYPHVKTQKYLAVESKCVTCAELEVEGEKLNAEGTQYLAKLYAYHGMMYRGQRQWYHDVRQRAHNEPTDNPKMISQITDGAAQVHTSIPHYGKSGSVLSKNFDTHLQGIITHGHRFTLFRSFGNVGKGTNVAIYGWLRLREL